MTCWEDERDTIISIHAPERGATRALYDLFNLCANFNPRSRTGSDVTGLLRFRVLFAFQSTLPNGERLALGQLVHLFSLISIHAPERGATYERLIAVTVPGISIHAPERGATTARSQVIQTS